jgi:hypothetical protein
VRLSEIRGERVFDTIADIIEPACNIASDPKVSTLFDRSEKRPEGMTPKEFALSKVKKAVPELLRGHKGDVCAILAAIEGQDAEQYAREITVPQLIKGIYELVTDEDLLPFLS